jgi:alpha-ketoglutarate-dependent taurine dioxygenase
LDIHSGETISAEDRRMFYQKANMFWHCDSAFKAIPSLCSVLTARIVPPQGGATELASTRAVHAGLNAAEQADVAPVRHRLMQRTTISSGEASRPGSSSKSFNGFRTAGRGR